MGIGFVEVLKERELGLRYSIMLGFIAMTPSIKNNENSGFVRKFVFHKRVYGNYHGIILIVLCISLKRNDFPCNFCQISLTKLKIDARVEILTYGCQEMNWFLRELV